MFKAPNHFPSLLSELNQIQKTIYPLKLLNKYRLPIKIKYKIESYLTRFESKVSFNCYEMFDVISETYLDVSSFGLISILPIKSVTVMSLRHLCDFLAIRDCHADQQPAHRAPLPFSSSSWPAPYSF